MLSVSNSPGDPAPMTQFLPSVVEQKFPAMKSSFLLDKAGRSINKFKSSHSGMAGKKYLLRRVQRPASFTMVTSIACLALAWCSYARGGALWDNSVQVREGQRGIIRDIDHEEVQTLSSLADLMVLPTEAPSREEAAVSFHFPPTPTLMVIVVGILILMFLNNSLFNKSISFLVFFKFS